MLQLNQGDIDQLNEKLNEAYQAVFRALKISGKFTPVSLKIGTPAIGVASITLSTYLALDNQSVIEEAEYYLVSPEVENAATESAGDRATE